ncbi:FAD-dependent oxidoreductase [Candidatus Legionella polyplacis]|uniref:FAD-dependent oxidoreductase n=1 Tax=Candidatus Legionella polyplacis TaxID=2005262 RepID=A0ABZ2GZY3_9GAMM
MIIETDILIIGSGIIGMILALTLKNNGYKVLLIEKNSISNKKSSTNYYSKNIFLSLNSIYILKKLKIWNFLQKKSTPIYKIYISAYQHFGKICIERKTNKPVGYIIEANTINKILYKIIDKNFILCSSILKDINTLKRTATIYNIDSKIKTYINFQLIVASDGTTSSVRKMIGSENKIEKIHKQKAITANITIKKNYSYTAYKYFKYSESLAVLPINPSQITIIWILPTKKAQWLLNTNKKFFLKYLQKHFGYKLGKFICISKKRLLHQLYQSAMPKVTLWPIIFIGNAANTLHPIGAQGFNLGLRDINILIKYIIQHKITPKMLISYQNNREKDHKITINITKIITKIFKNKSHKTNFLRSLGFLAINNIKFLKKILIHYTLGYNTNLYN